MKKPAKIILIIAAVFVSAGILFSVVGFFCGANLTIYQGENGFLTSNMKTEETVERNLAAFQGINVNVGRGDVIIIPSDTFGIEMTYCGYGSKLQYSIENGVLKIDGGNLRRWGWFNLDFSFVNPKQNIIKIYVPEKAALTNVTVKTALGKLDISHITTDQLVCTNNLGEVKLADVSARISELDLDLGSLTMERVNLGNANITNDLGEIKGTGIIASSLKCDAAMGEINLQGTFTGLTDIDADMDNVNFETTGSLADYSFDLDVDMGHASVNGSRMGNEYKTAGTTANKIKIDCSMGDVDIKVQ